MEDDVAAVATGKALLVPGESIGSGDSDLKGACGSMAAALCHGKERREGSGCRYHGLKT
jgi:hypothetical protein